MITPQAFSFVSLIIAATCLGFSVVEFENGFGRRGFWLFISAVAFGALPFLRLIAKAYGIM